MTSVVVTTCLSATTLQHNAVHTNEFMCSFSLNSLPGGDDFSLSSHPVSHNPNTSDPCPVISMSRHSSRRMPSNLVLISTVQSALYRNCFTLHQSLACISITSESLLIHPYFLQLNEKSYRSHWHHLEYHERSRQHSRSTWKRKKTTTSASQHG